MKIENLKELSAVIDLCRRKGVARINISGIEMELTDSAPTKKVKEAEQEPKVENQYTDEQLLLWSSAQGA